VAYKWRNGDFPGFHDRFSMILTIGTCVFLVVSMFLMGKSSVNGGFSSKPW
jgi:hypothetical protein